MSGGSVPGAPPTPATQSTVVVDINNKRDGSAANVEEPNKVCQSAACRSQFQKLICVEDEFTALYAVKGKADLAYSERRTRDGRALQLLKKKVREKDAKLAELADLGDQVKKSTEVQAALTLDLEASKIAASKGRDEHKEERARHRAALSKLSKSIASNDTLKEQLAERDGSLVERDVVLKQHEATLAALRDSQGAVRAERDAALERDTASAALLARAEADCAKAQREAGDLRAEMGRTAQEALLTRQRVAGVGVQTDRTFEREEEGRRQQIAQVAQGVWAAAQDAMAETRLLSVALQASAKPTPDAHHALSTRRAPPDETGRAGGQEHAEPRSRSNCSTPPPTRASSDLAAGGDGAGDGGSGAGAAGAEEGDAEMTVVQLARLNKVAPVKKNARLNPPLRIKWFARVGNP